MTALSETTRMSGPDAPDDDLASLPLGTVVRALVADTRSWLEAETHVYSVQAKMAVRTAVTVLMCAGIMLTLVLAMLVALVVGILFLLMPLIGTGWALAAVVAGCLVFLVVLSLCIRHSVKNVATRWRQRRG